MGLGDLLGTNSQEPMWKQYLKMGEGFRGDVYNDTKGIPTVGYGFNVTQEHVKRLIPKDVLSGQRELTKEEGDRIFNSLVDTANRDVQDLIGVQAFMKMNPDQRLAVLDMSYNMGRNKLGSFEKMIEAIKSGDYQKARKEMLNSKYAREDVPTRAMRNANLMYPSR